MNDEHEYRVTATTTVTATFTVWAESEQDATDLVSEANVTGQYAFDYRIDVPDADHVDAEAWDAHTVTAK